MLAAATLEDPRLLTPAAIATILSTLDQIVDWATKVKEYAFDQAINHGVKWPGYKLVEGRSNRKFTDKEKVKLALLDACYTEDQIMDPASLKTLTDLETLVGKKPFDELVGGLITKAEGKPTLVSAEDKRPEIGANVSAKSDFKEDLE